MSVFVWFMFMFIWVVMSLISASKATRRRTVPGVPPRAPGRVPPEAAQPKTGAVVQRTVKEPEKSVLCEPAPPGTANKSAPEGTAERADRGVELVFSRDQVVQGIIIAEVLGRPRCLRR